LLHFTRSQKFIAQNALTKAAAVFLKDVPGGKSFMTARREKAVKRRKMKF
jgi:hypothetical protein